ncbi:hypothetical protein [Actinoplanes sp. G11-F43]|uniref:hypothetical protein n=1 Tax=Actinoplanes sp. G11-F43 TaxID=3424130 RepID=UPI003D3520B9
MSLRRRDMILMVVAALAVAAALVLIQLPLPDPASGDVTGRIAVLNCPFGSPTDL